MASLGSLYFDIKFNSDPKELEEMKQNVLKQLAELEVKFGISPSISKEQLVNDINQVLNEKFKLNLSVNKDEVEKSISDAVKNAGGMPDAGIDTQMGYIDSLIYKLNELESKYKELPKGADPSILISQYKSLQSELDNVGRSLSAAFSKSFSEISSMSEKTIGEIRQKIKFLEQYKITIPIDDGGGMRAIDHMIDRLKSTLEFIKKDSSFDPFSLAEKTLDNIKVKITEISSLRGSSVINSDEYKKASEEIERLKRLQTEALNPPVPTKTFAEVMGMDASTLDNIKNKLSEIRNLRGSTDVTTPAGMGVANELAKEENALIRVQKEHANNIKIQGLAEGSIQQLKVQVAQLILAYDELGRSERTSAAGEDLLKKIQKTTIELSEAEQASMRYQRNVGNYKSSWNGLQFQLQQLGRELPSIAYGANIFFAAISNNLPMFMDEVKKAKLEFNTLKEAQRQGMMLDQKAVPVWKQLVGGIFSWQTAMVALITVLTLYGAKMVDWIGKTLKFKNSVELTKKEIKELNKSIGETAGKELVKLDELFNSLKNAKEGTLEYANAKASIINQFGGMMNGMNAEIISLDNQAASYRALTEAIYQKAKAQTIETTNAKYAEERLEKQGNEYLKIYDQFIKKYGEEAGEGLYKKLQGQLEAVGKIDEEMMNIVEGFSFDKSVSIGTSITGSVQSATISVNKISESIGKITKAQETYNRKVSETEKQFAYLGKTAGEVVENKIFYENQKKVLQNELDLMSVKKAEGEEGRKIKEKILEIDEKINAYETKSKEIKTSENKELRDQLNLLKNAYDFYKEWMSLGAGKDSAISMVNDMLEVDFNPDEYRKSIEDIMREAGKKDNNIRIEAARILTGLDKESVSSALSDTEKYISETISKWNLFDKLFEKTGDFEFSISAAFGGGVGFKSVIDQLKSDIEKELEKTDIPFDKLIQMSPENIKSGYGGTLSALVKAYQDQNKKIKENTVTMLADLLSETKSYEQKRAEIISKWGKIYGDASIGDKEREAAKGKENKELASLDYEQLKNTELWIQMFEDLDRVSGDTLKRMISLLEEFSGTASQLPVNEFKEYMNTLKKIRSESESRNPLKTLIEGFKELRDATKSDSLEGIDAAKDKIRDAAKEIIPYADILGDTFGSLSEMFDSLGNEGMARAMDNAREAMNSISNIGQGFAKGGLIGGIGAAVGEAANWIGRLARAHDEKLNKSIEDSVRAVNRLQNAYAEIERTLKRVLGGSSNLYKSQKSLLQQQLAELEKQKRLEEDKGKDKDQSKIDDYNRQISEAKDQLRYFAEDLASELYGIDLKGWASQLGDALFESWKKGEDGATAFRQKAAEIMGDVMNEMLKIQILEPLMKKVRIALFGRDGESGYFGKDYILDKKETEKVVKLLMEGQGKAEAYEKALEQINDYMEKNYGVSLKDKSTGKDGLASGIKGVSEDTASLIASYMNAIRADGAKRTSLFEILINDRIPEMNAFAKAQLVQMQLIAANTGKNASMAEEIRDLFSAVIAGTKSIKVT